MDGRHPPDANRDAVEAAFQYAPDEDIRDLILWMYEGYVDKWGYDEDYEIIAVEHSAVIWLPTAKGTRSNFRLKMKIDLVLRERTGHKRLWVNDHKSGARLPSGKDLDLDEQFGLYTWGMRQLGHPVFGQIHDAARTQRNVSEMDLDDRFRRTLMARTDREITNAAVDAWRTAKRAYALRKGEAERHYNTDTCGWRCGFREACLWGRKTGDEKTREFLRDTGFVIDKTRH